MHHPAPTRVVREALGHPKPPRPGAMVVLMAERIDIPAGHSYGWHTEHCWELCVQRAWPARMGAGGVEFEARPGDVCLCPVRYPHGTWNTEPTECFQNVILFEANAEPLLEHNPLFRPTAGRPLCRLAGDDLHWFDRLFHQLWWEQTMRGHDFERVQEALLRILLIGLERHLRVRSGSEATTQHVHEDVLRFATQVRGSLDESDPLQAAARHLGLNYDSLRHRFKTELGISPKRLLVKLRVERAKSLLMTTSLPVAEIAARLGYADAPQFSRLFARETGAPPSHWRQNPHEPTTAR